MTTEDKWGLGVERQATAHHEAGHALTDIHFGLPLESVDIRRENGDLGGCQGEDPPEALTFEVASLLQARAEGHPIHPSKITPAAREWIDKMIRSKMAGRFAEERFRGRPLSDDELLGIIDDQDDLQTLAGIRWSDGERTSRLRDTEAEVVEFMADPAIWSAVSAVAQELLKRETLAGGEVKGMYQKAMSEKA